jgi:hypothetical protein
MTPWPKPWLRFAISPALAALLTLLLSLASGCKQCTEEPPKSTPSVNPPQGSSTYDRQAASAIPRQLPVLDHRVFALAGQIDAGNRYISTVRVRAQQPSADIWCSGVIIHPRLVLTAGHCVCARRKPSSSEGETTTIIDSSACAASALVTTITYEPAGQERRGSDGQVQPHPDLKFVLGPHGQVLSSTADLAAIFLSEPLSESFRPVPLATREVQLHEFVTIVGYGYDEIVDGYTGDRRFSKNHVTMLGAPTPGRILIEQQERHPYKLDSGGPCLREGPSGSTLVGVSGRSLGEEAAFTSTFPYREWVRAQLRRLDTPH